MTEISSQREKVLRQVLALYPCTPLRITQIKGGFVNQTYLIETKQGRFVLRSSSAEKTLAHLNFEISILRYLQTHNFSLTAHIIKNKKGGYYIKAKRNLYILQSCLPGRGVASWLDLKGLTLPRLRSYFAATAKFSGAIRGFKGRGPLSAKNIGQIAATAHSQFDTYMRPMPSSPGKRLLLEKKNELKAFFSETVRLLETSNYKTQPRQIVHFDLQPGNFHFTGNAVVGLFDFDWARTDSRLVDLAATICQSCYHDRGPKAGLYKPSYIQAGLVAYLKAWREKKPADIQNLVQLMPAIQRAYDTYQFLFIMEWYGKNLRAPQALKLLRQFINLQLANDHARIFEQALSK